MTIEMQNQKALLQAAISSWLDKASEKGDCDFQYIGENLVYLMTNAAWNVLEASMDVQDYLIKEGHLK